MPRLSIVIPLLGNVEGLEETLVSVLENRPVDCQIVVVLNRPYDDPYDLKDEVCFVEALPGVGLVDSANVGISASRAPIVHLLSSGVEVSPDWADVALAHFDDPSVAAVAPLVLEKDDPQRVITAGVGYRAAGMVRRLGHGVSSSRVAKKLRRLLGPDTRAAFYRKSALKSVGRFSGEVGDRLTGVDLALKLRHAGFRCIAELQCRTYAEGTVRHGRDALRDGMKAERLFWRWAPQHGWRRSLIFHAMLLGSECLQTVFRPRTAFRLVGRLLESLQILSHRRHWQALRRQAHSASQSVAAPHFSPSPNRAPQRESAPSR